MNNNKSPCKSSLSCSLLLNKHLFLQFNKNWSTLNIIMISYYDCDDYNSIDDDEVDANHSAVTMEG